VQPKKNGKGFALTFLHSLEISIREVLNEPQFPIQSGTNFASREEGLASGLSGLVLMSSAATNSISEQNFEHSKCRNIFTSNFSGQSFSNGDPEVEPSILGDVFEGSANRVWTDLVFNRFIPRVHPNTLPGNVVRTGLGHGELVREFVLWYSKVGSSPQDPFETSEKNLTTPGWCNGLAGEVAVQSLVAHVRPTIGNKNTLLASLDNLIDLFSEDFKSLEFGLCHGFSGSLVTALGVARQLGADSRAYKVREIFANLAQPDCIVDLAPGLYLDSSWLTGSAGLVWASKVMERIPLVNPLLPIDSLAYKPT
jgi:hypothetical protein